MSNKTATGLVAWAKTKIGCPYWYGTFGQTATADLLEQKIKQYKGYYTSARIARCKGQYKKQVFDCVGLIKGYMWYNAQTQKIIYNPSEDLSADGMLLKAKEKGSIGSMPDIPGLLVHMSGHVGVYIGNGQVIEATVGNGDYAVKRSELKGRGWTKWSKCPFISYDKVKSSGMKLGDSSVGVLAYKMGLLTLHEMDIIKVSVNADGVFGNGTQKATETLQKKLGLSADGIADAETIKGMTELIRKAHKTQSDALASARKKLSQIKNIL